MDMFPAPVDGEVRDHPLQHIPRWWPVGSTVDGKVRVGPTDTLLLHIPPI